MKALCASGYTKRIEKKVRIMEVNAPTPTDNDVLIEVVAAALNPADYKLIYGAAKLMTRFKFPLKIGFDCAGSIIEVGKNVTDFKVGDEVYTKVPWNQMGTIAELACVEEGSVSLKPNNMSFAEAASIPLVGTTVYDSFQFAHLKAGDTVLIHGGSGGIGTFAIQYAKYIGAKVITTTSTKNIDLVKSLGADVVIDYTQEDFTEKTDNVDVVYDAIGKDYPEKSLKVIKNGGVLVTIAGYIDEDTLSDLNINPFLIFLNNFRLKSLLKKCKRKDVQYKHIFSKSDTKRLDHIREVIESGHLKAVIDRTFPFEQALDALKYLETERAKGKVIIELKDDLSQA